MQPGVGGVSLIVHRLFDWQSDLESNVSELDDSASGHHSAAERITKEQIYQAYQKTRSRYHKYKGRYADLAKHYRELERDREKVKVRPSSWTTIPVALMSTTSGIYWLKKKTERHVVQM